jgi:hypothetical protein
MTRRDAQGARMNRHTRRYMPIVQEEETVASLGDAGIVKTLDGGLELIGGGPEDRQANCDGLTPAAAR